uniref:Uncharacterized protein n=1 Tax=Neospora caninum (strain Liverpool) TaxID=572307 RepID=A0A0F7UEK1_NEOCL|nr:TPA: hypothetical protein BN1204_032310 [Neospora caninum Liverpool]
MGEARFRENALSPQLWGLEDTRAASDLGAFLTIAGDEILILLHLFLHRPQPSELLPSSTPLPSVSSLSSCRICPSSTQPPSHSSAHSSLGCASSFSSFTSLCPLAPLSLASRSLLLLLSDVAATAWPLTLPLPHFFLPSPSPASSPPCPAACAVSSCCPSSLSLASAASAFRLAPASSHRPAAWPAISLTNQGKENASRHFGATHQEEEGRGGTRALEPKSRQRESLASSPLPRQLPAHGASPADSKENAKPVDRGRDTPRVAEAREDKCDRVTGLLSAERPTHTAPPAVRGAPPTAVYVHHGNAASSRPAARERSYGVCSQMDNANGAFVICLQDGGETDRERHSSRSPVPSVFVAFEDAASTHGTGVRTAYSLCCYFRTLEYHWRRLSRENAFTSRASQNCSRPFSACLYPSFNEGKDTRCITCNERTGATLGKAGDKERSGRGREDSLSLPRVCLLLSASGSWLVIVFDATSKSPDPLLTLWRLSSSGAVTFPLFPPYLPSSSSSSLLVSAWAARCSCASAPPSSLLSLRLGRPVGFSRKAQPRGRPRHTQERPELVAVSAGPMRAAPLGKTGGSELPSRPERVPSLDALLERRRCPPLLCRGETRVVLHREHTVVLFRLPSLSVVAEIARPSLTSVTATEMLSSSPASVALPSACSSARLAPSSHPLPPSLEAVLFLLSNREPRRGRGGLCWWRLDLVDAFDGKRVLLGVPPRRSRTETFLASPFSTCSRPPSPSASSAPVPALAVHGLRPQASAREREFAGDIHRARQPENRGEKKPSSDERGVRSAPRGETREPTDADERPTAGSSLQRSRGGEKATEKTGRAQALRLAGRLQDDWYIWSNSRFIVAMQRHCYHTPRREEAKEAEDENEDSEEDEEDDEEEEQGETEGWQRGDRRREGETLRGAATAQETREMTIRRKGLYSVVFWPIRGLYRQRGGGKRTVRPSASPLARLIRRNERGGEVQPSRGNEHTQSDSERAFCFFHRVDGPAREGERAGREETGDSEEGREETEEREGRETESRLVLVLGRKQQRVAGRWGCAVGALVEDFLVWSPSESLDLHITQLERRGKHSAPPVPQRAGANASDWETSCEALPALSAEFGGYSALACSPVETLSPPVRAGAPFFASSVSAVSSPCERERRGSLSSDASREMTVEEQSSFRSLSSDSNATDASSVLSASLFSSPSSSRASTPKSIASWPVSPPATSSQSPRQPQRPAPPSEASPRMYLVAAGCTAGAILVGVLHRTPLSKTNVSRPIGDTRSSAFSSSSPSSSVSSFLSSTGARDQRGVCPARPSASPAPVDCRRLRRDDREEPKEREREWSFDVLWCISGKCMRGYPVDSLEIFLDASILVATHRQFSRVFDLRSGRCLSRLPSPSLDEAPAAAGGANGEARTHRGEGDGRGDRKAGTGDTEEARKRSAEHAEEEGGGAREGSRQRSGQDRRERAETEETEERGEREERGETLGNEGEKVLPVVATVGGGGRRLVVLSRSRKAAGRPSDQIDFVLESFDFAPQSFSPLPCELLPSPSFAPPPSPLYSWSGDPAQCEERAFRGGASDRGPDTREPSGVHPEAAKERMRWWRSCRGCRGAPGDLREAETGELFCTPLCFEATKYNLVKGSLDDSH